MLQSTYILVYYMVLLLLHNFPEYLLSLVELSKFMDLQQGSRTARIFIQILD